MGVAVLDDDHGTQAVLDAGEVGGECACVEFGGEVAGGFKSDDEVPAGASAVSERRGDGVLAIREARAARHQRPRPMTREIVRRLGERDPLDFPQRRYGGRADMV